MKKLLLLATLCFVAAPASRVWAQNPAPQAPHPTVSVVGAVGEAGSFPFVTGENVAALLKRVGGASSIAAPAKIYVLRQGIRIPLDLSQEITAKFVLRAGDVLVVPENSRRISVVGDVARPGAFTLTEQKPLSIIDALNAAGGTLWAPDEIEISVVRAEPKASGQRYYWPADSKILSSRSLLKDGDVVYVSRLIKRQRLFGEGGFQLLPLPLIR